MKININVDDSQEESFPLAEHSNYPKELEALGGLATVEIEFYDAETQSAGGGTFTDSTFCGNVSQKGQKEFTLDSCGRTVLIKPQFDIRYIGNDFLVSDAKILSEFGPNGNWSRRPLPFVLRDQDRDEKKRWIQTGGKFNLRAKLLRSETNIVQDCSPDLLTDHENKGGIIKTQVSPNKIVFRALIPGKYGLAIQEIGNKSVCHSVHQVEENAKYCIDWLGEEGLLFANIDSYSDKIKITASPTFDSDEVKGNFINAIGGIITKVRVFWMPRHWAFYTRLGTETTEEVWFSHSISFQSVYSQVSPIVILDCGDIDPFVNCEVGFFYGGPYESDEIYSDEYPYGIPGASVNPLICLAYCEGEKYSSGSGIGGYTIGPWSGSWVLDNGTYGHFIETKVWEDYHNYEAGANSADVSMTYYLSATCPTRTQYVGLWWDRWPGDFDIFKTPVNDSEVKLREQWNPIQLPNIVYTLVGDESYDEAIEKLTTLGLTEEEAKEIILGGQNSIHHMSHTVYTESFVKIAQTLHDLHGMAWTCCDLKPIDHTLAIQDDYWYQTLPAQVYVYGKTTRSDLFKPIWDRILASNYWTQYGQYAVGYPDGDAYIDDDIPFGLGISPNKTGTLLAVVKVGSKRFYVWQKTDEVLTERRLAITDNYAGHFTPFEPSDGAQDDRDSPLGEVGGPVRDHFIGENRKLTSILPLYSVDCIEHAAYGWFEDLPTIGKRQCWTEKAATADVELEMPVYVMISRERALDNGARVMREQCVVDGYEYLSFDEAQRNVL